MKGGKREGAGRKPSANPYPTSFKFRTTDAQLAKCKALGAARLRDLIDAEPLPVK